MVIKKCSNGESSIDWTKTIGLTVLLLGIVIWGVQVANQANNKAEVALAKIDMVDKKVDRMDSKIDKLVERN